MKRPKKEPAEKKEKELRPVEPEELQEVSGGATRLSRYNDDDYGNRTGG